jgi:hypothetical protein
MRLINADQLEQTLTGAINMMTAMAAAIGAEEDEGVQMELKAYKDILDGVKEQETVKAITLDWIRGYIETCDMFQLRVNVPASRIISVMVNTWKQENPGAKRGETDADND